MRLASRDKALCVSVSRQRVTELQISKRSRTARRGHGTPIQ